MEEVVRKTAEEYDAAMQAALRGKPTAIFFGQGNKKSLKLVAAAIQRGHSILNGVEVPNHSRRKVGKLANRWRGGRRGKRLSLWLAQRHEI